MTFSHPLARIAKVWSCATSAQSTHRILVVVTTLELDASEKKFNKDNVERLQAAAQEWVSFHQHLADGYMLVNRPKDW